MGAKLKEKNISNVEQLISLK